MTHGAPDLRRRTLWDWAALGGAVYVILFVIGNILIFRGAPSGDDAPAKFVSYYGDSGHRDRMSLGWIAAGLGLLCFLWFLVALREALCRIEGGGPFVALATVGGGLYAALALVAVSLDVAVRTMSDDTFNHQVFPDVIHAADDAGYMIHAAGGVGVALLVLGASLAFVRGGAPRWVGWVGGLVALAAVASIVFVTMFLWLLWILVVSVLLSARAGRGPRLAGA